ncbi:MAG: hypothetical protein V2A73_11505, partial [Pseudomonadota bacterium]
LGTRNQELEQPPRYGSHLNRRPESRIKSIGWPPSIEQSPSTLRDTPDNAPEKDSQPRMARSLAFEGVPASAVVSIIEGPPGTLVAGYANGFLGIWNLENGTLLDSAKLHGPVVHLLLDRRAAASPRSSSARNNPLIERERERDAAGKLYAVTELGDYFVWDLDAFYQEYCELLGNVWSQVPVVWQAGLPVVSLPPAWHKCAAKNYK